LVSLKKKIYAVIAAIILMICLVFHVADFFSPGGLYGGDSFTDYSGYYQFGSYIFNKPTVTLSMGYTPRAGTVVLYCTYKITDSNHKTMDNSIMLHPPFSSEYIIYKTLTNLANDNYTFTIYAQYSNGTVHVPFNETFRVDTNFKEPKLTLLSPQNQTYNTNKIDIIYNVNSDVRLSYYNLDGKEDKIYDWKHFNGNITLYDLSEGPHKLMLFISTEADLHRSSIGYQIIYFKIDSGL
jgi:hypothetical protein